MENPADSNGLGSVSYAYNIGEYDVTVSQYAAFLNAVAASDPNGVYNSSMAGTTLGNPGIVQSGVSGGYSYNVTAGRENLPVTDVTFWDAARFANWMSNGQPTGAEGPGTTETGAYQLSSANPTNSTVVRSGGGTWAVSSENEWYKAAYYSPTLNAGSGGYWRYPTQSNTISSTQANYDPDGSSGSDTTPVGAYPFPSYYGTYDQAGNVIQWDDTIVLPDIHSLPVYRGWRGAEFNSGDDSSSTDSGYSVPYLYGSGVGFRISQVPEPASFCLTWGCFAVSLARRPMIRRIAAPDVNRGLLAS